MMSLVIGFCFLASCNETTERSPDVTSTIRKPVSFYLNGAGSYREIAEGIAARYVECDVDELTSLLDSNDNWEAIQSSWEICRRDTIEKGSFDPAVFFQTIERKLGIRLSERFRWCVNNGEFVDNCHRFFPGDCDTNYERDLRVITENDIILKLRLNNITESGSIIAYRDAEHLWQATLWKTSIFRLGKGPRQSYFVDIATSKNQSILLIGADSQCLCISEFDCQTGNRLGAFYTSMKIIE